MKTIRVAAALGRQSRLAVAVLVALGGAQSALHAQADGPEEVVVTGTRIRATGIDMPNPVTVVTRDELSIIAPTNMIEGLAELPQFYGSSTTQNPGGFFTTTGAGSLNLRGLQSKRTLQLLDGRRVVPSTIFGGPDINLFPENMVRTVETVTGGATAAYGTDAVAGAVNFILDTDYEGVRANLSTGENEKGHNEHYEVSFGAGFALGERSHLLVSAEKSEQDPLWGSDILEYDWYKARALIENPDTVNRGLSPSNPFFLPADRVYSMNYSLDGIFHLPANAGGTQILDANGNPSPFVLGSPCNTHGCSTTNGGSGIESGIQTYAVTPDSGRENLFTYFEHRFDSNLTVFGQLLYGQAEFTQRNFGGLFPNPPGAPFDRAFTIFSGNPFLPPSIQQAMTANGVPSVQFSRIGAEEDLAFDAFTQQITETTSLTGGIEYEFQGGGFFDEWQLRGYYQQGETDVEAIQRGGIRLDRIYLAADVVINPATGQPACNVTVVSGLYPDCVPLNLFGRGRASAAAIDWVTGFEAGVPMQANGFLSATESLPHSYTSTENKQRIIDIEQTVWEVSMDGQLAEGWAGPITMAFGGGFREESFTQVVEVGPGGNVNADPTFRPVRANNAALGIRGVPGGNAASGNSVEVQFSNVPFARGDQDVAEVFTELLIPLVNERRGVQQLTFNGAARWADYSGSGQVQSWKGGFDWAIVEPLRLRMTVSEDVRAATMGEKFDRTGGIGTITDYLLDAAGTVSYGVTTFSNGTPDIKPEQAKTKTIGFVFVPARLDNLSFSLDWYNVDVTDNINQITANQVAQGCYQQGNVDLCQFITRGGAPSDENPAINYISLVGIPYYNQASVTAQGVDFELNYARALDWFGGGERLGVRLLGSFLNERSDTNSVGLKTYTNGGFGLPEWTAMVSANYSRGPLMLALTTRYTDSMAVNLNWNFMGTSTRWDVYDNEISSEVVTDLRFNYNFDTRNGRVGLFLNVNNLFGMDAEEFLNAAFSSNFSAGTGLGVTGEGDRGRRFTVGVRMDF
jgi:iron complex outermembrane receptor protein